MTQPPITRSIDMLLQASDLTFGYNGTLILDNVSFTLHAGEFVGLVGPNGAGKSTLLKLITGFWRSTEGHITLLGKSINHYAPKAVAQIIALVPQTTSLDFAFTARELVLMGRSPHLGRFQVESAHDRAVADQAMQTTDILPLGRRFVNSLSGGERQRVLIARALAQEPRVLLLDEPTSNLDIKHQLSLLGLVRDLAHDRGLGVVAAIHDLALAARFCDRIVLLSQGSVVAAGSPAEVFTQHTLVETFGVEVKVETEPVTGGLRLTPLRPVS